ncbi:hypothetical protein IAG25_31250 [Caballeronia sp. EK]|uniref:hypothetical protein n=1 Tax=Caballeronia sp. EK TaxID=2767469 RepID=UPI00199346E8|nr:hypothetical protein [Caballeronia sp. EK]MBC8641299.1 hypothetical protein [Caballeronia sp. EK]
MKNKMPTLLSFSFSSDWADKIYTYANIVAIFAACLAAVCTFLSFRSSQIRDYYADQRRVQYEAMSETARKEAARANESAAVENEKTEKLRESNLILRQQAEHERAERLKLEAKVAPRTMPPEYAVRMAAAANEFCPRIGRVAVTAANGNQEAQAYASVFVRILRDAGCHSELSFPIPGLRPDIQGVHIGVRDVANMPEEARLLLQMLTAGNVSHDIGTVEKGFSPDESFVLVVGAKQVLQKRCRLTNIAVRRSRSAFATF